MANRRSVKKDINFIIGDVIEECYSEILNNPGKKEKEINAIIDDAVDLADSLITRTNKIGKDKGAKNVKADFAKITSELKDGTAGFIAKLNKLS